MHKIILYFCCLVLALAVQHVTAEQGAAQNEKADNASGQPIPVTAAALTKAYGNATEGNTKYLNKILLVEGKILRNNRLAIPSGKDTSPRVLLELEGFKGPEEKVVRRVVCEMNPSFKRSDFTIGDTIKVQGTCKGRELQGIGRGIGVDLKQCEVVK